MQKPCASAVRSTATTSASFSVVMPEGRTGTEHDPVDTQGGAALHAASPPYGIAAGTIRRCTSTSAKPTAASAAPATGTAA